MIGGVAAGAPKQLRQAEDGIKHRNSRLINRKQAAAQAAMKHVRDGMRLGIGTGSTAEEFIRLLADGVRDGLELRCVATSNRTEKICDALGIRTESLNELEWLDLTVDGADEMDSDLNLVKGGGGALLREKIVAAASGRMIAIADDSKLVDTLGAYPLPIEVVEFGMASTMRAINRVAHSLKMNGDLKMREENGRPFVTDSGNRIVDASFGRIRDANALANGLASIPGVVEHGLFLEMADLAYIGQEDGVRELRASPRGKG